MAKDHPTDEENAGPARPSALQRLSAESLLAAALAGGAAIGTTGCGVDVKFTDRPPGDRPSSTQKYTPPPPPTSLSGNADTAPAEITDERLNFLNQLRSNPPEGERVNEEMKALLVTIQDTQGLKQAYYNARINWLETMKNAPRDEEEANRRKRLLQAEKESADALTGIYRLWNNVKPDYPLSLEQARDIAGNQRNTRAIPALLTQAEADSIRLEEERRLGELYRKYPHIGISVSQQLQAEHARADAAIDQITEDAARRVLNGLVNGKKLNLTQNELLLIAEAALVALDNQATLIKKQTQEAYIGGHPFAVEAPEPEAESQAPASQRPAPAQNGNAVPANRTEIPAATNVNAERERQKQIEQNRKRIEAITNGRGGRER